MVNHARSAWSFRSNNQIILHLNFLVSRHHPLSSLSNIWSHTCPSCQQTSSPSAYHTSLPPLRVSLFVSHVLQSSNQTLIVLKKVQTGWRLTCYREGSGARVIKAVEIKTCLHKRSVLQKRERIKLLNQSQSQVSFLDGIIQLLSVNINMLHYVY